MAVFFERWSDGQIKALSTLVHILVVESEVKFDELYEDVGDDSESLLTDALQKFFETLPEDIQVGIVEAIARYYRCPNPTQLEKWNQLAKKQ